ncbi:MAG: glycosyltransferase [Ferruginibacter sp.]|nr:glycosyltransferase [Ferruginibacter sp.]
MPSTKKITVSVISDLTTDQRVIRICTTLQLMGFDVMVIARSFKNSLPLDNYSFNATRINCIFRKGILQYAEFNLKLFFKLFFCKSDYFLANDLDVLIPNYIVTKIRKKKIFYDTHEYFTGVPELKNSHLKRKTWKFFEDWIFPKLPVVYTINDSVKNKYNAEYKKEITVVRNVPITALPSKSPLPLAMQNKIILLLQGAGINIGRGGLELLKAMQFLPNNYYLIFVGSGTQWQEIKKERVALNLLHNTEMIDKVPPAKLKEYTACANIGFSLDSFNDLNCLYNLPNKIFDYIHANVPIIATAIPEVKRIVEDYNCGICLTNYEPQNIANTILDLVADKERYNMYKNNCTTAAKELCWENESKKIIDIYTPYL